MEQGAQRRLRLPLARAWAHWLRVTAPSRGLQSLLGWAAVLASLTCVPVSSLGSAATAVAREALKELCHTTCSGQKPGGPASGGQCEGENAMQTQAPTAPPPLCDIGRLDTGPCEAISCRLGSQLREQGPQCLVPT